MKFTFELPPPINQTYGAVHSSRLNRTVFFKSYAAKKWAKLAHEQILSQFNGETDEKSRFKLTVAMYLTHPRDIDSGLKTVLDIFSDTIYKDDKQVDQLIVTKEKSKEAKVEVEIEKI